jgi:hypothetical protein
MRLKDVVTEAQDLNELSLGGIGRGLEKVGGGLAKTAGYVAGIPAGLGKSFQKGKARAVAGLGGDMLPPPPKPVNPDFARELAKLTGKGSAAASSPEIADLQKRIQKTFSELKSLQAQYAQLTGTAGASSAGAAPAALQRTEPTMGDTQEPPVTFGASSSLPVQPPQEPVSTPAQPQQKTDDLKDLTKLAGLNSVPAQDTKNAAPAPAAPPAPPPLTAQKPSTPPETNFAQELAKLRDRDSAAAAVNKYGNRLSAAQPGIPQARASLTPQTKPSGTTPPQMQYGKTTTNTPAGIPQVPKVPGKK